MDRKQRSLFLATAAALGAVALTTQLALSSTDDLPGTKHTSLRPLGKATVIPLPSDAAIEELENLNQCAGTIQHYRLPPTGYLPPSESAASREGKKLYDRFNCASCHQVGKTGGELGPPLDGIGGHRGEQFLVARLLDPEAQMRDFPEIYGGRPNIMPHLGVSHKEAKLLARYLLTLPEPAGGFLISAHQSVDPHRQVEANTIAQIKPKNQTLPEREKSIQAGRNLFLSHSCALCHTVGGTGGKFGPRLDGVAMRRTDEYLEEMLSNGTANAAMQAQSAKLSAEEVLQIVDFLKSLPRPEEPPALDLK